MEAHGVEAWRSDPRALRVAAALQRAVLELAAETAAREITVTSVCARARVSRTTFYKHASSPSSLLREALLADLVAAGDALLATQSIRDAVRDSIHHLADHANHFRPIYAINLHEGRLTPEIRGLFVTYFGSLAELHLARMDLLGLIPTIHGYDTTAHRGVARQALASALAHSSTSAIEVLVSHPETIEIEFVVEVLLLAVPDWVQGDDQAASFGGRHASGHYRPTYPPAYD